MLALGDRRELDAMSGEQGLVGSHHRFAGRKRGFDCTPGRLATTTHQLNKHIDTGLTRERVWISKPFHFPEIDAAIFRARARAYRDNFDGAATPGSQCVALVRNLGYQGGTNRAQTGNTHFQRLIAHNLIHFSGSCARSRHEGVPWSASCSERHNVVQLLRRVLQETLDIAGRLTNTLLVFHECNAHKALAVFAEADARRNRDVGLLHQKLGKFHAAETVEGFGNGSPGKHRRAWRRDVPASTIEALNQNVAPTLVRLAHLPDAVLGAVECGGCRDLHRREGAIVEIRFYPAERRDNALIADRETNSPARH